MGYNKYVRCGNQIELYEYEYQSFARGRPRGYKFNIASKNMASSGDIAFLKRQQRRRDNAQRTSMAFKRLILSNLGTGEDPLLFTFTFAENRSNLRECYRIFHLFMLRMRYSYGEGFRYVGVPEFQKRGAVHYHALFWGLSKDIVERERKDRTIAKLWGQGFVDVIKTDGNAKLSSYLAKYMVKAIMDVRLMGSKAYFASKNILRPIKSAGFPMWWFEDEFSTGLSPLLVKQFDTQWMGKGRYTIYQLKKTK